MAIQAFDAWMLADEGALTRSFGQTVQRQPDPEDIRDPKEHLEELMAGLSVTRGKGELYAEIADLARIEVLKRRCRRGFIPFEKNVRALINASASSAS